MSRSREPYFLFQLLRTPNTITDRRFLTGSSEWKPRCSMAHSPDPSSIASSLTFPLFLPLPKDAIARHVKLRSPCGLQGRSFDPILPLQQPKLMAHRSALADPSWSQCLCVGSLPLACPSLTTADGAQCTGVWRPAPLFRTSALSTVPSLPAAQFPRRCMREEVSQRVVLPKMTVILLNAFRDTCISVRDPRDLGDSTFFIRVNGTSMRKLRSDPLM